MTAIERIREERVVGLLRAVPDARRVADALVAGGIRVLEVTLDSEGAETLIGDLRRRGDAAVLAGTVRTAGDVDRALAAGAEACVSPAFSAEVVARCVEVGLPAIPGSLTPTEIEHALAAGAALVKLFPAGVVGPTYVRDVLAPLRGAPLLATGGIDVTNAAAFLRAGAVAVAVGTALTGAEDPGAAARALVATARSAGTLA
jgi:2-dehydro-3-deoxyphosphogluconate aldolase/(4S)-4-hydroxy-2-oxoglutarate aldolase